LILTLFMPQIKKALQTILNYILTGLWKTSSYLAFSLYCLIKKTIAPRWLSNNQYKHLILPGISVLIIILALSETVFAFQGESLQGPILLSKINQPPEKLISEGKIVNPQSTKPDFTIASIRSDDEGLLDPTTALGGAAIITPDIVLDETPVMRTDIETYVVQPGDTFDSIAKKFAISIKSILWENKLTAASIIRPGQELRILPVDGVTHTVKKGETLQQIANYYKASVEDIVDFNDLADASDIHVGDFLIIPAGQIPPPPPPQRPVQPKYNDKTFLAQKQTEFPAPEGENCHVFVAGQCTWYVARKRCIPWTGHARSWIANARRAGFTIGKTPAVGAVIALNESWYGHVAYVEAFDNTTVTFSEMNHLGKRVIDQRTLNLNDKRIVGYIY